MESINIYQSVKLYKSDSGYHYTDTYGELHEFASSEELWEHLTDDGEIWPDEIHTFIFAQ